MGSPITLSGFNKIDFNMILSAVMEQERAPIRMLEAQKKTYETQNTAFGTFAGKLAKAQVTTSTSTYASLDDVVATAGTLSLLKSGNPPVDIVITGSMSVKQLADAINANSNA